MTRKWFVIAGVLLLALALVPTTPAQTLGKDMVWTVREPVALPETVLTPGTYQLRFVDMQYSIALLSRHDGTAVGLFQVMRADRPAVAYDPLVVVGRLADGSKAIAEWFYPGDLTGFRFLYPGEQPAIVR